MLSKCYITQIQGPPKRNDCFPVLQEEKKHCSIFTFFFILWMGEPTERYFSKTYSTKAINHA